MRATTREAERTREPGTGRGAMPPGSDRRPTPSRTARRRRRQLRSALRRSRTASRATERLARDRRRCPRPAASADRSHDRDGSTAASSSRSAVTRSRSARLTVLPVRRSGRPTGDGVVARVRTCAGAPRRAGPDRGGGRCPGRPRHRGRAAGPARTSGGQRSRTRSAGQSGGVWAANALLASTASIRPGRGVGREDFDVAGQVEPGRLADLRRHVAHEDAWRRRAPRTASRTCRDQQARQEARVQAARTEHDELGLADRGDRLLRGGDVGRASARRVRCPRSA